jgi:hypothetical protein
MMQTGQWPVEGAPASFQAEDGLGEFAYRLCSAFAVKDNKIGWVANGDAVVPMVEKLSGCCADHVEARREIN